MRWRASARKPSGCCTSRSRARAIGCICRDRSARTAFRPTRGSLGEVLPEPVRALFGRAAGDVDRRSAWQGRGRVRSRARRSNRQRRQNSKRQTAWGSICQHCRYAVGHHRCSAQRGASFGLVARRRDEDDRALGLGFARRVIQAIQCGPRGFTVHLKRDRCRSCAWQCSAEFAVNRAREAISGRFSLRRPRPLHRIKLYRSPNSGRKGSRS